MEASALTRGDTGKGNVFLQNNCDSLTRAVNEDHSGVTGSWKLFCTILLSLRNTIHVDISEYDFFV